MITGESNSSSDDCRIPYNLIFVEPMGIKRQRTEIRRECTLKLYLFWGQFSHTVLEVYAPYCADNPYHFHFEAI